MGEPASTIWRRLYGRVDRYAGLQTETLGEPAPTMTSPTPSTIRSPLHLILSEKLREQILTGQYLPGEKLPIEHQLTKQFDVSRITVRRALANFANQGLIVARQGKGVFVKKQQKKNYRLSNQLVFFEDDMARQGITSSIQNLVFESILAPQDVRENLKLSDGNANVYLQKKLLLLNRIISVFDVSYIVPELGKAFAKDL